MRWPQFNDPDVGERFRRQGFAVAPLLQPEEVAALRASLDAVMQDFGIGGEGGGGHRQGYISYYNDDPAYQERVARCVRDALEPTLARVVQGYRVSAGGAFFKPPGADGAGVHCDFNATADAQAVTFTLWCALDDADEANGAMCMLPGSHKVSGQIIGPGTKPYFHRYPDKIKARSVPVPVRAGDAVMFQTGMIHWSFPNRTEGMRPAAHIVAVPEGVRHVIYIPAAKPPPEGFDVLDVTDVLAFHTPEAVPSLGFVEHVNRALDWPELERLVDEATGKSAEPEPAIGLKRYFGAARKALKGA
jgi:hypothetical protein